MSNSNQSPKDNPKYLQMADDFADKYRDKEDHEESDVTVWTRLLYAALHLAIIIGTVSIVSNIAGLSRVETIAFNIVAVVIALTLEYFKGLYMERYFIAELKSVDANLLKVVRVKANKSKALNIKILGVFWLISAGLFCTSGYFYAKKNAATGITKSYDTHIETAFVNANAAVANAVKEQSGSKTVRDLTSKLDKARSEWTAEKAAVDAANVSTDAGNSEERWNYGLIAIAACILLEFFLFAARRFHETLQYKISSSLLPHFEDGEVGTKKGHVLRPAQVPTPSVETVDNSAYDQLMSQYNKLEKEYADLSTKSKQSSQDLDYAEKRLAANHDIMKLELATLKDANKELEQKNGYLERLLKPETGG